MNITYETLQADEWDKLKPLMEKEFPGWNSPKPELSKVAVAKDGDKVIGFWFLQLCAHGEPVAIDSEYSEKVSLFKLRQTLFESMPEASGMEYYVSVTDPRLAEILDREGYKFCGALYSGRIPGGIKGEYS